MMMNLKQSKAFDGVDHRFISGVLESATAAWYSAYADDVFVFVKSKTEIDEFGREISWYETVTGAKINYVCFWLGAWKGVFPRPFT